MLEYNPIKIAALKGKCNLKEAVYSFIDHIIDEVLNYENYFNYLFY